jgi:hypothetical protein
MLTWNLSRKVINMKRRFFMAISRNNLHGDTKGCLILKRTIYGLVQSAREFYNKLVLCLKGGGFMGSPVDPCLWI